MRSPVPDLLFEEEQARRVAEIRPWLAEPEELGPEAPIHRVTIFVTYRCNLDCPYCKTIARSPEELAERPQKGRSHDLASFAELLDSLQGGPPAHRTGSEGELRPLGPSLRHLHFTGGEAALSRDLPAMLALARSRGVERLSLTSNGTLPVERYRALVEAGLDELRLSLDADNALLGQELTGRSRAWERTVATARALGEDRSFYFILNAVVAKANRSRVADLVAFLLTLRPDDIKLITSVDEKEELGDFPGAREQLLAIEALLAPYPAEAFPLLRRKLGTVFSPEAIGLTSGGEDWRCYIPLTERTVDRTHYYPCSVYLRENGAPLGELTDSPDVQRARTARFVREGDCQRDPICRRYCLHCTRAFNDRANEARAS